MSLQHNNNPKKYRQQPWHAKPKRWLLNIWNYIVSFLRNSGIHGLAYFTKLELILLEKLFWFILVVVSFYYCVIIGLESVDRYYTKNTVVSVERDYYFWRTKTTSITICPLKRINGDRCSSYAQEHNIKGERKEQFCDFMEHLANSTFTNFKYIPEYDSIDGILDEIQIEPKDYMKFIYNLTGDLTLNVPREDAAHAEVDDLPVHTRQVLTEWGLCYMANTVLGLEYTAKYMIYGDIPEEYTNTSQHVQNYEVPEATYFENDLIYNIKGFMHGMHVYIHSIYEVMHINRNLGFFGNPVSCTVESMPIITEDNFKKQTSVAQRKCRFTDESNLQHYPIYTKNMCMQECRLRLAYKLCKCIPHFYPNRLKKPKRVCSYKELRTCFPPHERVLMNMYSIKENGQINDDFNCNCMDNCQDANIIVISAFPMFESSALFGSLGVMVYMKKYPTFRLKRQIIFTFTDLLVSIGGTAGLFLGFSVLGAIEMIYYFTLRLIWYLRGFVI